MILQRWAVLGIFLIGVGLRWASLGAMNTMLHYDEAYNALDALGVLRSPQFTPFFPGNFGREGGFVYWLVPFVGTLNGNPLALRMAATILGILTLAATYRLAREVLRDQGAVWSLAAVAVLYWHVHLSHLALRANLFVLIGTLSAAWLLHAHRTNRRHHWARAGIATGLLSYTYFPSTLWIGYAVLALLTWSALDTRRRRGAMLALLCAAVAVLPMGGYILSHPEQFFSRPQTVAVLNRAGIIHNLERWAKAWLVAGDPNATFNLPERPILDPETGVLGIVGLVTLGFLTRRRWQAGWLIGWGLLAGLPSLLSNQAPHFLRAAGLTIPTALIIGAGAQALARLGIKPPLKYLSLKMPALKAPTLWSIVPLVLLALAGYTTYVDYHQRWLTHPETFKLMEEPLNRSINYIRSSVPPDVHVYFSPFTPAHPVIGYRSADLAPRPIGAFDSHQCLVIPDTAGVYVSLTPYEPSFLTTLATWRDASILYEGPSWEDGPARYTVIWADPPPPPRRSTTSTSFGDRLSVRVMQPMSTNLPPGTTVPIVLGIRAQRPLSQPLSIFVHLYGDPTPYEGGPMWAQADSQICASYPTVLWHPDETVIQTFVLATPSDLPKGSYSIVAGVYQFPDGARLPVTAPPHLEADYVTLKNVTVR